MAIVPVEDAIDTHGNIATLAEVGDGPIHVPGARNGIQQLLVQCVRATPLDSRVVQQCQKLEVDLEVIVGGGERYFGVACGATPAGLWLVQQLLDTERAEGVTAVGKDVRCAVLLVEVFFTPVAHYAYGALGDTFFSFKHFFT